MPTPTHKHSVGLLGGSFNPPHEGHIHISLEALNRLQLDEIWWLVSPQNPMKPRHDMASLEEREALAIAITKPHPSIQVLTIEKDYPTNYSYDTVVHLQQEYPEVSFVWLMGADNWCQFSTWHRWKEMAERIPIAVFDRAPYTHDALNSVAAQHIKQYGESDAALADITPPIWQFFSIPLNPLSSTAIRAQKQGD